MSDAEILLEGVDKAYGETVVLRDFTLRVMPGEFLTAVGGSGSGKTTVLKLINGLVRPDGGRVRVKGVDVGSTRLDDLRRGMGYVVQGAGLFPHMTVRGNIAYVPALSGKKTDEARLRELLAAVQLDAGLLDRYPHELSGGQKQRVGLARALAGEPRILLMDEPFGAVDEITRKALQASIREIHDTLGVTVLFITHDISEALSLGTRVMVLNKGHIDQLDTPEAVTRQPATPYVEALLGSASCSLSCH